MWSYGHIFHCTEKTRKSLGTIFTNRQPQRRSKGVFSLYLKYQGTDLYQTVRCSKAQTRSTLNVERSE